jgi:cytochrome c-type biogenesis protein CcmF
MAREPLPLALVALIRRNRRRYGGYIVHAGVAVLFVGVAASSSFHTVRDVRMTPGQTATVGDYRVTYVRPTAVLKAAGNGRLERIALGAQLRVQRRGGAPQLISTSKEFYPSQDPTLGPVSRFFDGDSTTQVGLREGSRNDIWTVVNPDTSRLAPRIAQGDRVFERAKSLTAAQANMFLSEALVGLVNSYAKDPPPATFRVLISPLVTWIWLGAVVILLGGLLAAWPSPRGMARAVRARYAARVGREVRIPA